MVASGNQYEICIKKGREHRAVLTPERVNSPTEFFYTAYQDAKYQLWEIILASFQNKNTEEKRLSTKKRIELLHEYPNNLIAFCADRGRGKTTAMLSFSNALEMIGSTSNGDPQNFWGNIPRKEQVLETRFEVMSPIDSASMENSESVLQQIISQLFENFCVMAKNHSRYESGISNRNHDALADKFQKCAQAIDSLYADPKARDTLIEDELDKIAEIGQSGKLLLLLHELIDEYLAYMRGENTKCCLVVQIDDSDMDIGRSYQILEDVRKYLGLPRVIVLMATNIQQLETTVEQHFLKEYKCGLKYDGSMITVERCHNIAVLYLEKAIPLPRRIYLPDIGETIRQHRSSLRVNYEDETGKSLLPDGGTYQKQLLDLVHRKTGLVFTFESDYLHNLLPAHMRELCQFLPFFDTMEDVPDGYQIAVDTFRYQGFSNASSTDSAQILQNLNRWEQNLKRLEFYLVNLWSAANLREGSRNLFRDFVAQPETVRNLYLLRKIEDYYIGERIASENTQSTFVESNYREEFEHACELRGINLSSYLEETVQGEMNVSNADVLGVLAALTDLPGSNRQYKFAYAIRLFYSIRLHIALIREIRIIGSGDQSIHFHTLTSLLRDTLLKNGPVNDTAQTPFGCWILEMPVQWFSPDPYTQQSNDLVRISAPFLRWKYKRDHTIRMFSTVSTVETTAKEESTWRTISIEIGQKVPNVVVFNPLYPLLDALDRFVRLKNVWMLENDMHIHQAQIYIALLICLNWDVQRVLFKSIKNQAGNQVKNMMQELYSRYIEDLLKSIPVNVPAWLLEPLPESKDHCLADRCYADLWQESNQYFFDILTTFVHPVPEFKQYIQNTNSALVTFSQSLKFLQKKHSHANTTRLRSLNIDKNDPALEAMDNAACSVFCIPNAVSMHIKEKISKNSTLYKILSNSLETKSFSLTECSFSPSKVYKAMAQYRDLLEELMQRGPESIDVEPTTTEPTEQQSLFTEEKDSDSVIATSDLSSTGNLEASVHTLQGLIQLGQQIVIALSTLQQSNPISSEHTSTASTDVNNQ